MLISLLFSPSDSFHNSNHTFIIYIYVYKNIYLMHVFHSTLANFTLCRNSTTSYFAPNIITMFIGVNSHLMPTLFLSFLHLSLYDFSLRLCVVLHPCSQMSDCSSQYLNLISLSSYSIFVSQPSAFFVLLFHRYQGTAWRDGWH